MHYTYIVVMMLLHNYQQYLPVTQHLITKKYEMRVIMKCNNDGMSICLKHLGLILCPTKKKLLKKKLKLSIITITSG